MKKCKKMKKNKYFPTIFWYNWVFLEFKSKATFTHHFIDYLIFLLILSSFWKLYNKCKIRKIAYNLRVCIYNWTLWIFDRKISSKKRENKKRIFYSKLRFFRCRSQHIKLLPILLYFLYGFCNWSMSISLSTLKPSEKIVISLMKSTKELSLYPPMGG